MSEVRQLHPQKVWNNFEDLNAVPRPSKKEERVIAFITSFLQELNLDYEVDHVGNVIARKPATAGMENRRPVVLQSHLDMVHQKNADTEFDFNTQGIVSYIDGDWVTATGTTLGADNGMGVAAIMSILESTDIPHPPLEALFTIDEESGMTGAHGLQAGKLQGEILMNLDTEDDDELSIGCAGGIDTNINWEYVEETEGGQGATGVRLKVSGLSGGHSGMDIIYGRANANKIMNRLLLGTEDFNVRIGRINGGGLRNAIPREAVAELSVSVDRLEALQTHWEGLTVVLQNEFATTDPKLHVTWEKIETPKKVLGLTDQQDFLNAIQATHDGIKRLSPDVKDLVETSNNLAQVNLGDGKAEILCLQRSDREGAKYDMAHTIGAPWHMLGAAVEHSGSYPGWKLDPSAPMLQLMRNLYVKMYNEEPKVMACHAGLECGLLSQHYPDMEMISFGPTIRHPHSPDEKVNIASVEKFWNYFLAALKSVPERKV